MKTLECLASEKLSTLTAAKGFTGYKPQLWMSMFGWDLKGNK